MTYERRYEGTLSFDMTYGKAIEEVKNFVNQMEEMNKRGIKFDWVDIRISYMPESIFKKLQKDFNSMNVNVDVMK